MAQVQAETHLISYNRDLYGLQSFGIICSSLHEVVKQLRIRHAAACPVSNISSSIKLQRSAVQRIAVSGSPALSCRGQGSGFEARFTALPECRTGCENCFQIKICNTSLRVSLSLAVSLTLSLSLFPSLSVCLLCLLLPPPPDVVANAVPLRFARPKLFPLIAAIMRCSRSRYLSLPRSLSYLFLPLSLASSVGHLLSHSRTRQLYCTRFYASIERRSLGEREEERRRGGRGRAGERASKVWE